MTMYNSLFSADKQVGSMGKISSAMLIGQVTASFLGGLVAQYLSESLTFLVAAVAGLIGLVLTFLLPEPGSDRKEPLTVRSFVGLLGDKNLIFFSLMAVILQLAAYTGAFGFVPNILRDLGASNFLLGLATPPLRPCPERFPPGYRGCGSRAPSGSGARSWSGL